MANLGAAASDAASAYMLQEGDRSIGLCEACRDAVPVRYAYRDLPLDHPACVAEHVLVAICEQEHIVSIPWQSNHLLVAARRAAQARAERPVKFEARLPMRMDDAIRVIGAKLELREDLARPVLVRYYLTMLADDPGFAREMRRAVADFGDALAGPARARLSVPVALAVRDRALDIARETGLGDQSALARAIVATAWRDVMTEPRSAMPRVRVLREARRLVAG